MQKHATVGQVVRARRETLGITREQLAVYAHVSVTTISQLELVDRVPKHAIMRRIAEQLGLKVTDLYAAAS